MTLRDALDDLRRHAEAAVFADCSPEEWDAPGCPVAGAFIEQVYPQTILALLDVADAANPVLMAQWDRETDIDVYERLVDAITRLDEVTK